MQSPTWYMRRLQVMSPGEIAWRTRTSLRNVIDRCLLSGRQRQLPAVVTRPDRADVQTPPFRVCDMTVGEWADASTDDVKQYWRDCLVADADRIAEHRLSFFDLTDSHLGTPVDWNRDHKHNKAAPMTFAPWIDYRDFRVTGDCKFVWEPNRHHQFVVLARAYRATGNVRYARAVIEQLDSWLDACPFGIGMNWRSPLELGTRLINWIWSIDLIREARVIDRPFHAKLLNAIWRHMWEIARNFSRGSSAGNHLIGEAAGLFIAAAYFPDMKNAPRWRNLSAEILQEQMIRQTYSDGGGIEQALGYHLFILKFMLTAALTAGKIGHDFADDYWQRLEAMFDFQAALCGASRNPPLFGDCDDGFVLNLGSRYNDFRETLAIGAVLHNRPDFKVCAGTFAEPARWLIGRDARARFDSIDLHGTSETITSRAFCESGYYLLQSGHRNAPDCISVVFDCGPLGLEPLAGHGHADALSFTLRAFGRDILVDPGTYDYFTYPHWRTYFRSTHAHNTAVIDRRNQSEIVGPFAWGKKANARCLAWRPNEHGGTVTGEHDGYARRSDPVIHRRTIELDGAKRLITIKDNIVARGHHEVEVYFHFTEDARVTLVERNVCRVNVDEGAATLILDEKLSSDLRHGSEHPISGWVSRGYHHKAPSTTLVAHATVEGETSFVWRIQLHQPAGPS